MNNKTNKQIFEEFGYLIVENLISHNLIDIYVDELSRNLGQDINGNLRGWAEKGTISHIGNSSAMNILCNKSIQYIFESLDKSVALYGSLPYWVSTEKRWHQDSIISSRISAENKIGVWIALEDISIDAGPFEYIPCSHIWELDSESIYSDEQNNPSWSILNKLIKDKNSDYRQFIALKGDAIFWDGHLVHRGSEPVNRQKTRKSLIGHYNNKFAMLVNSKVISSEFENDSRFSKWLDGCFFLKTNSNFNNNEKY